MRPGMLKMIRYVVTVDGVVESLIELWATCAVAAAAAAAAAAASAMQRVVLISIKDSTKAFLSQSRSL